MSSKAGQRYLPSWSPGKHIWVLEGDTVVCSTTTGHATVSFPDAIALGVDHEV